MPTEAVERKIARGMKVKTDREATYEERKAIALAEGKKYLFLTCPLCGINRPLDKHLKGRTVFTIKPDFAIIQARYGIGGRGKGGFFLKEDESIFLKDLKDQFPDVYSNLRTEIKKLYKLLHPK